MPVLRVGSRSVLLQTRGTAGGCRKKPDRPERIHSAKGDSLWKIAQRFYGNGAACYALAHKNGIKNPDLIYPGQVLKI
uniref:LysM peptidoglycan-binding domain-containing protein n=1 Tax=Agathobacter rectalis TaxID=39491 RepID=UPI003562C69A